MQIVKFLLSDTQVTEGTILYEITKDYSNLRDK